MKYFISGGAGFIGSNFVKQLIKLNKYEQITIYDNFSSGTERHIIDFINNPKILIIKNDIKNLEALTVAMNGANFVAHFAANPDIAKAITQPDIDFWEGTYLTNNILESMRKNNIKYLIYTSGSGVYGEVQGINFDEKFGPCKPISTYGASKLACEALISSYCHMFDMKARAFRFANVVGPLQTHGVGYDFIRKLKANPNQLTILGDGSQTKSYIYIDDVISAIFITINIMLNEESDCYDVYNVSSDDYISVTKIAELACIIAGLERNNVNFTYTGGDRGWKGDVPKIYFDASKIKSIGWHPKLNSAEAIKKSLKYMNEQN